MSLCLAAAGLVVALATDSLTLRWTHSMEKILWEEDWVQDGALIRMSEARVRGSGAGMEPPPEARLVEGAWRWVPKLPSQPAIDLRRSGTTADWQICIQGMCRAMDMIVPAAADPVSLRVCE